MTYIIEKNIPPPAPRKPLAGNFPFADMDIGDSFALNGELPQTVGYLAAVFARRQNPPWKFKVGKIDGHHRCWRLS